MKNMKKVFAFVLALAMILTTYQPTATYAATKAPMISAKKMTLQVGSKKTLTVKNAGKNATLKWSSSKKNVATVSKKGVVKAVKAGTANVKCKVVTKSKKHYTLTCKVTVKNAVVSKTVSTQKALASALKDKNVKNLTIKTDNEVAFNIPSGNYGKVNLTVDAPNADVVNAGTFKSINIKAIKPNTWKEKAKGNTITVTADDARIVVEAGASLSKVTVSQEGGKIKIEAAGTIDAIQIDAAVDVSLAVDGTVGEVAVSAPAKVAVEGKTTAAIPIKVEETAKGADVTSSTPVEVKAATEISLNLSKGAEGSKVETTGENAQVAVKNDTTDVIKVTTPAGTQEVAKDTTSKVDNTGKVTDTTTNTSGDNNGGSTSGGSTSGGNTSGGGSASGGSTGGDVTPDPGPTPSETYTLNALHLFATNQMDVEIPEKITDKDKIEVRDADGNLQKVAELNDMYADEDAEDGEEDTWQRYMITFASDLTPGEYTFSYTGKEKIYQGEFKFTSESLAKTEAAAKKVQKEILGQTYSIQEKGKDDVSYAADQLDKIAYAYGQENDFWAGVYDYADAYTTSEDGTIGLEVTIRVQGEIGAREDEAYADVVQDLTGMVYFTFDKQPAEVKVPQVIFETQTSIVVKAEEGQAYVCLDADKTPDEDDWEDAFYVEGAEDVDDFGNIEFDKLSIGKSYRIWSRNIKEADVEEKSDEITLTEKNPQIVCLADSDKKVLNLGTVTTSEEDDHVIQIPRSVKISNYGQVPENMYLHGETDNVVLMKDGQKIESGVSVSLPHSDLAEVYSVDGFEKGEYTLTYDYYYCCSDNTTHQRAVGSQAVTYQVTFTIE